MDFTRLKLQLLQALRGNTSQIKLSRELGFSFNQVHKWESNQKHLRWSEFFELCQKCGVDLQNVFESKFGATSKIIEAKNLFFELRKHFGEFAVDEVAEKLEVSPSTVRRWFSGTSEPDVEDVFNYIYIFTSSFVDFVSLLVDPKRLPVIAKLFEKETGKKAVRGRFPFACAVESCLSLREYKSLPKHSDDFVSRKTSLGITDVQKALKELLDNGVIELDKDKYVISDRRTDMDAADLAASAQMAKYWTQKAADRFNTMDGVPISGVALNNMWAYRVFPVTEKSEKEVKELLRRCYGEIMAVLEGDLNDNKDKVKVLIFHLFGCEDFPDSLDLQKND